MTSGGSAYARFRRALDARDAFGASAAALELPHVGLADALELTLIFRDKEPARYERAALRWHARLCKDAQLTLDEAAASLGLLAALRGRRAHDAARSLADLIGSSRTLLPVAEVLVRWSTEKRGRGRSGRVSGVGQPPPAPSLNPAGGASSLPLRDTLRSLASGRRLCCRSL